MIVALHCFISQGHCSTRGQNKISRSVLKSMKFL